MTTNTPPYPDQALDRVNRLTSGKQQTLLDQRPNPPKGLKLVAGVLTWEPPKELANITHFKVYSPDDVTLIAVVSAPQARLAGVVGPGAFVSAYSAQSSLESIRVGTTGTGDDTSVISLNGLSGALTLASLSANRVMTGSALALTTSFVDIAGCTYTTTAAGTYDVTADIQFLSDGAVDGNSQVRLLVDGGAQSELLECLNPAPYVIPGSKTWGTLVIGSGKVVKLQAKKVSGAGTSSIGTSTSLKLRSGFSVS